MNKETLKQIYEQGGYELVMERLGCSSCTAYKLLKKAGITLNGGTKKRGRKTRFKLTD